MLILTLRTDKPDAEISLHENEVPIARHTWHAHRSLAETLLATTEKLLKDTNKHWKDVEGIIVYQGPGSFTGLRIGITVANTIAATQQIPVVASGAEDWIQSGVKRLLMGDSDTIALPEYGAPVHITAQKK